MAAAVVGGWKAAEADELNAAAVAVKGAVEAQAQKDKKQVDCYTVESGTKQVVAGMNYKIRIKVGENRFINIKVYRSLPPMQYELKTIGYEDE